MSKFRKVKAPKTDGEGYSVWPVSLRKCKAIKMTSIGEWGFEEIRPDNDPWFVISTTSHPKWIAYNPIVGEYLILKVIPHNNLMPRGATRIDDIIALVVTDLSESISLSTMDQYLFDCAVDEFLKG